jgi:hypothetical protein
MDGLRVHEAAYGVYHPDYDAHVYRNIYLHHIDAEPINRGHDDESVQYGTFTYEDVTMEDCRPGRDPLIQLTCTSPLEGQAGHFRHLTLIRSASHSANVVDLGGGPRNDKLQNGVAYYFHDMPGSGSVTKVLSDRFAAAFKEGEYRSIEGFTGADVRASTVTGVEFPTLLEPTDDLAPATMILSQRRGDAGLVVRGISHDNGDVASVSVNGRPAKILSLVAGVADWEATSILRRRLDLGARHGHLEPREDSRAPSPRRVVGEGPFLIRFPSDQVALRRAGPVATIASPNDFPFDSAAARLSG